MSDYIETWLRRVAPLAKAQDPDSPDPYWWSLTAGVTAAADEIERLREQNDYLKANVEMLLTEAREVRGE